MKTRCNTLVGFTVMEVSIALGIFSIIVAGVIGSFLTFFPKAHDISIEKGLSTDLESIYNLIENKIKEADSVEEPALGYTSSKLILRYTDSARDPTIFSIIDRELYLEEGTGLSYIKKKVNSDYFIVESLNFTNLSGEPNNKDIKIDLKISLKKDNKTVESSQTYSSFPKDETIIVVPPPPIISFSANPNVIVEGDNSILTWMVQYADSCNASGGWTGQKATSGTQNINPVLTTTYILSCAGPGGSSAESLTVTVIPKLTASCSASPDPALINQPVTFSAQASGGTGSYTYSWSGACTGTNKTCSKTFSSPNTYSATVTISSGTQSISKNCSVTINVPSLPTLNFSANPSSIISGETSTLTWSSSNTNSCLASGGWTGPKPTSGNTVVSPTITTTYSLTCSGLGGVISKSASVVVRIIIEPPCLRARCNNDIEPPTEPPSPSDGGGGGGGGGSVVGYTNISGSNKHIEDLKTGDIIYGVKDGRIVKQEVQAVWSKEPSNLTVYRVIGNDFAVELSGNHLVWVNGKWLPARDITVGDILTTLNNESGKIMPGKVTSISKRKIWIRTYTLKTDLGHYFAGGVMIKNGRNKKM